MEALAERLTQLDSQAEAAIRIVGFFDTLMRRRIDLPALARASAGLAECKVGIRLHGTGLVIRAEHDGREVSSTSGSAPPIAGSMSAPVTLDDEEIGAVWLDRPGPPNPLDAVLLDRLAIAAAATVERYAPARTTMADPALVEMVISSTADEAARARALRLLGFAPDLPLRVVAVRSMLPLDQVGRAMSPARLVKAAPLAGVGVILASTVALDNLPSDLRAGIGSAAGSPHRSWQQARTALRFADSRQPVVSYDELGALALLAEIPAGTARENTDVNAIDRLAAHDMELETLDAYCAAGSLRQAADLLHLHHSSVARRLDQIGTSLGINLAEPAGLLRARIALTTWQLLDR